MKKKTRNFLSLLVVLIFTGMQHAQAQLEKIIVETYYVSDANDAGDTIGGGIAPGTKTYRIYADMKPGSKLKKIFGNAQHNIKITSTAPFFNNVSYGKSFGYENTSSRLRKNTTALDTYITLGKACQFGSQTLHGIPKIADTDGSIIGGVNNDGGSQNVSTGLLIHQASEAGRPLTEADGLMPGATVGSYSHVGIIDMISQNDSTIFGSLVPGNSFESNNMLLQNSSGVEGAKADSNQVLLFQLTTSGEITFKLNLEIEYMFNNSMTTFSYVSDSVVSANAGFEKFSPFLSYPFVCGCLNKDYLEYNERYACNFNDSCKTKILLGCTDKNACNYDPNANFNVPTLCCYPGDCNDRTIETVCPQYNPLDVFYLFPNPCTDMLTVSFASQKVSNITFNIQDFTGNTLKTIPASVTAGKVNELNWDVRDLNPGIYFFQTQIESTSYRKLFIKINP
jgi:hypothetical protein